MSPPFVFSYETWVAMFPIFAPLSPTQGNAYAMRAALQFANSCSNPAYCGAGSLDGYFYLVISHIAWLSSPKDANGNPAAAGAAPSPLVGRISNATEGSVSVQTEWDAGGSVSPNEAYWLQTPFGAEFWTATAPFRTARYLARPTIVAGTFPFGRRYGFGA
jgi:hypothetical protein